MKLIKGENLTTDQLIQVKAAFIHRWTTENLAQTKRLLDNYGFEYPRIEPNTDEKFIKKHAFWFKDNGDLASKPRFAEPVYMADDKEYIKSVRGK
jgi:hypothetical protein